MSSESRDKKCYLNNECAYSTVIRVMEWFKSLFKETAESGWGGMTKLCENNQDSQFVQQAEIVRKCCTEHHPNQISRPYNNFLGESGFRYKESIYLTTRCSDVNLNLQLYLQLSICLVLCQKGSLERRTHASSAACLWWHVLAMFVAQLIWAGIFTTLLYLIGHFPE